MPEHVQSITKMYTNNRKIIVNYQQNSMKF